MLGWDRLIRVFLQTKLFHGVSENTIQNYFWRLKCFSQFVKVPPTEVSKEHILHFLTTLREQGKKPSTIYHYHTVLKVFFKWLAEEGLRKDNPTQGLKAPKVNLPVPEPVTLEHFLRAISLLKPTTYNQARTLALLCFLLDTGCRVSEALNLRVGDVDLVGKVAVIRQGKGGKQRFVFFSPNTARLLHKYLQLRERRFGEFKDDDWLFLGNTGNKMERTQVRHIWHRLQKRAGLKPLRVHSLRSGFARIYLLNGGDAFTLQMLLGHSSPTMTYRYVRLWAKDLQETYGKFSPLGKVRLKLGRDVQ